MLWETVAITIKRKTGDIDINNDYIEEVIYTTIANVIEIKHSQYKQDISLTEPVQEYAFMLWEEKTLVRIWDIIEHFDWFINIKSKISENPKFIKFEDGEHFIKLRTKFIWN